MTLPECCSVQTPVCNSDDVMNLKVQELCRKCDQLTRLLVHALRLLRWNATVAVTITKSAQ